jgi:two-component sensor histidine kinase
MPQKSTAELEVALAEAVHRARNDLQAIATMLRLQASSATDTAVTLALQVAEGRVHALSNLNARLDTRAKGVEGTIDSRDFLEGLSMDIQTMHLDQRHITLTVQAEPHRILVDHAKPLGLVLNELIVNALKYAFPDGRTGTVIVAFHCLKVECTLTVQDDGVGFDPSLPAQGSGLGRRMVKALMDQIGGSVEIGPGKNGGTDCVIRWPAFQAA